MIKFLTFVQVLCVIALFVTLLLPVAPQAEEVELRRVGLSSATVFDIIAYPADGTVRRMTWTNDTGQRLLIHKAYIWIGMYDKARADSDAAVTRADGTTISKLQWDHYADPTAPVFKDDYYTIPIELNPGESLTLTYYTTPIDKEAAPFMAAVQSIIWYTGE
jgi:hypothetical protein